MDAKHQIIVEAQAHGTGSEQELLIHEVDARNADANMRGRDEREAIYSCSPQQKIQPEFKVKTGSFSGEKLRSKFG